MRDIIAFFVVFFFSRAIGLNISLPFMLDSIFMENSIKLTLGENNSYYFDIFFTLESKEFLLFGKNNTIYLKSKGSFLFIKNKKIIFSKLNFIHEERDWESTFFIFSFENAESIIFEVIFFIFLLYL